MKSSVLIVDDLAFVRMMIKDILHKYGISVCGEAANGVEAIKKYNELKPDIVLLDITMPVMNGLEALQRIIIADPHAKVIMCSALGQQKLIVAAIKAGAKDFIVKPFKEERLISAIKKVLEKH
ncbi:MAG: response regulator [Spirochaetales bacterium]|jgi:two-component system chemotaxis response regulator CheY|nr:response regulator [Exilispira sp.]NMC67844.1 response regulator [Spirochaetales bacterium]